MSNNRTFSENVKRDLFAVPPVYHSGIRGYTGRTSGPSAFSFDGPDVLGSSSSGPSSFSRAPGPGDPGDVLLAHGPVGLLPAAPPRYPLKRGISSGPGPCLGVVSSGSGASREPYYPEYVAKSATAPGKQSQKGDEKSEDFGVFGRKINRIVHCGAWVLIRSCIHLHRFGKKIDCGREWCEKCRASSHGRRKARWFSKLQKLREVGYLIITFPLDRRPRTAEGLKKIESIITGILKRRGFARGLRRWHTHGENRGGGVPGSLGLEATALIPGSRQVISRWHPHLNFLLDAGYLEPEFIDSIKKAIGETLKIEKMNLYYQYTQDVKRMVYWLKYVTRPTFLKREWDEEMAEELYDFRNSGWWGQWEDPGPRKTKKAEELRLARIKTGYFEDKWFLPEKEKKLAFFKKVEVGICPTCGEKLLGGRLVSVDYFSDEKNSGWEQIWKNVWQYKGPPENVLMYRLLKDFAQVEKEGAACENS